MHSADRGSGIAALRGPRCRSRTSVPMAQKLVKKSEVHWSRRSWRRSRSPLVRMATSTFSDVDGDGGVTPPSEARSTKINETVVDLKRSRMATQTPQLAGHGHRESPSNSKGFIAGAQCHYEWALRLVSSRLPRPFPSTSLAESCSTWSSHRGDPVVSL